MSNQEEMLMNNKKNIKNKTHYDNIIIGGGIVGAGIFRDLSLHGEEVLLVDKHDFTSQTSQSSSKMLHGGIRYLENFDFQLVHEALHEKIYWTKLLPHLAKEYLSYCQYIKNQSTQNLCLRLVYFFMTFYLALITLLTRCFQKMMF